MDNIESDYTVLPLKTLKVTICDGNGVLGQRFSEERERAINTEGEVQREVQRGSN